MRKVIYLSLCCLFTASALAQTYTPHIKVDQFGYLPNSQKVAIIANPQQGFNANESYDPDPDFEVRSADDNSTVYSAEIMAWNNGNTDNQSGDQVWWFNFSEVTEEGTYYIYDDQNKTKSANFVIDENVYYDVLVQATKVFYYQRCALEKIEALAGVWSDDASHIGPGQDTECRLITDPNNPATEKDLSGGWYDAGDYNKYVNFTYSAIHDLLFAYQEHPELWTDNFEIPESGNGIPDLLDEVKWELDWLLKMQETDGSVLMKVSVDGFQASSPPSTDLTPRYYGPAQASATQSFASMMAHAYIVFSTINDPTYQAYANSLLEAAESAWQWLQDNPSFSYYGNNGFSSANPENSQEVQTETLIGAAAMLFAATGNETYRDYVDNNYTQVRPIAWGYWFAFLPTIQDIMLYYSHQPNATPAVATAIQNSCIGSMTGGNADMLPAYWNNTGSHRAYMSDQDYTWGSNKAKSDVGNMHWNMLAYQLDTGNEEDYRNSADGFLHYLHGVNPLTMVMLSNMGDFGAENSVDEIYHAWFWDGSEYDSAETSTYGPAPGYLAGGANIYYDPDPSYNGPPIEPPDNQPTMKCFWDWNTSWPENSWEITEPSISYQAAYVRFLARYAMPEGDVTTNIENISSDMLVDIFPNPAKETVLIQPINDQKINKIEIYNSLGQIVWEQAIEENELIEVQVKNWARGTYYLSINSGEAERKLVLID